jgi:ABC-type phosphate/phosphonate transport system permease subunit
MVMTKWQAFGIAVAGSAAASVVVIPIALWATSKVLNAVSKPAGT